jgi:hypothetical protein
MDTAKPAEDETVDVLDLDLFADDASGEAHGGENLSEDHDAMEADVQAVADEIYSGFDFEKNFAAEAHGAGLEPEEKEVTADPDGFEQEPLTVQRAEGLPEGSFEIPEELADISDLAPPDLASRPASRGGMGDTIEDTLDLDDLILDDLDLSYEDQRAKPFSFSGKSEEKSSLSLDDIDLSGVLVAALPQSRNRSIHDDDGDLEFNLDLGRTGGIQGKGEKRKKVVDDLLDINLSLD